MINLSEDIKNEYPHLYEYAQKYGVDNLASTFVIPPRFKNNIDGFYKYCLEQNKRWEDIVNVPENVIL